MIGPPLRGGDWVALNGPSNNSVHRRALLVVNGMPRIAQRFAIDWVRLGPGGRLTHDDRSRNENWNGYGEEVLAVADGTVAQEKVVQALGEEDMTPLAITSLVIDPLPPLARVERQGEGQW